jgi:hypothetical protein
LPAVRDLTSLLLAAMILVNETLVAETSDPALVAAALALLGFPLVARADSRKS